jgi:Fe-S cluster assembly ATP-binding protein
MLEIKNLKARVEDKQIFNGIDLTIKPGEVHAIMGPNGSGKSTLAHVLSGRPGYEITGGEVTLEGKDFFHSLRKTGPAPGVFGFSISGGNPRRE